MLSSGCGEFIGTSTMVNPSSNRRSVTGTASAGLIPRKIAISGIFSKHAFKVGPCDILRLLRLNGSRRLMGPRPSIPPAFRKGDPEGRRLHFR